MPGGRAGFDPRRGLRKDPGRIPLPLAWPSPFRYNVEAEDSVRTVLHRGRDPTHAIRDRGRARQRSEPIMAKLRLLKTGHGDLCLAEWDSKRPETVAEAAS